MGTTRAAFKMQSNLTMIACLAVAFAAYLLAPYTNVWVASVVIGLSALVLLITLFVRLVG